MALSEGSARFRIESGREAAYLASAGRALESARLNRHYPDWRTIKDYLLDLGHTTHGGLYEPVELHSASGLPTLLEWTRIKTDRQMALSSLQQLPALAQLRQRASEKPGSVHGVQLLRRLYYEKLCKRSAPALESVDVKLRRIDADEQRAYVTVTIDRQHVSGLLVRHTVDLSERNGRWDRKLISVQEDVAQHTEAFGALVYRHAAFGAELLFMQLQSLPQIEVERVVQGSIGPFYTHGVAAPEGFGSSPEFMASFGLEMVGADVAQDRDNDPLSRAYLSEAARAEHQAARARQAYRVFKDRKFVALDKELPRLNAWVAARATRNISYGIPEHT